MSSVNMSRRSSRVMTTPPSITRAPPSTATSQVSNQEQKIVRRKLLDPKSELKNQIFGMHLRPDTIDFPTRITALIFDRTTKVIDAYEEYYKTKGLRATTRPTLLLESFEKMTERAKEEITDYELKSISKTNESFSVLRDIIIRTEKLHGTLPKIMFDTFFKKVSQLNKPLLTV